MVYTLCSIGSLCAGSLCAACVRVFNVMAWGYVVRPFDQYGFGFLLREDHYHIRVPVVCTSKTCNCPSERIRQAVQFALLTFSPSVCNAFDSADQCRGVRPQPSVFSCIAPSRLSLGCCVRLETISGFPLLRSLHLNFPRRAILLES